MKESLNGSRRSHDDVFPPADIFGFDITPYAEIRTFLPEETILSEGEKPEYLYYMIRGRAKLFLTHANGRITLINFLNAPCFLGEMELLDEEKYSDGVTAITACVCYAVRIRECRDRLLNDTAFLRYLCMFLSRKAVGNTANYSRNQAYPLKARLAAFILAASHDGMYREQHKEVAEYLGVTYRHLLYVFAEFVKEGILEKTVTGYRIVDMDAIRDASRGEGK